MTFLFLRTRSRVLFKARIQPSVSRKWWSLNPTIFPEYKIKER
ncbi:hypothetical protein LEP1GSC125_2799 [Leptospira mayottensis 200901122]|uniref:Uncharacterized protein n=1 Tax=Leptospira mayottensis 200901122 TaxID=1193010 RepID=A0AA87ML45_9LEPT|nr:hypothetical protein LEP1GSC125_2799 [Leptospira mayottensis 200901122]